MTYTPHFINTMIDHYQSLTPSCDQQEVILNRTLRMYKSKLNEPQPMCTYINHDSVLYCNFYPVPKGLTRAERKAHALLSEVTAETIIGVGIGTRLAAGTVPRFRELIRELNECITDNPRVMKGVLGEECFEAVQQLAITDVHKR